MRNLKIFILPLGFLLFTIVQCDEIKEGNEIKEFYIAPNFSNYKIKTVALLPMAYDDTTDIGTFYSTNYLYNRLSEEFKNFHLVDIDKIVASDSTTIDDLLISISDRSRINVDSFYNTDLGKFLQINNCDAILLGNVYKFSRYENRPLRHEWLYANKITLCHFNYFMVSLHDGSILWSANVTGVSDYTYEIVYPPKPTYYPPLDEAISNGIDALLVKLKNESILIKK